ncbi:aspartic peptidase domain-containing protein [Podospora aff. communis PSN243]|uniref:Aspartic peptidase domain-containing protein n=1 Tax=Podospora aff. communis PSN243 TaxID=3040156 RepID=A0AAV9G9Q8_9PEZI|nr:aspartic peptidase domain-containing protein [Podospora aff. communis PSN243]
MRVIVAIVGLMVSVGLAHPSFLGAPMTTPQTPGTASLAQVPNPNYRGRNGPRALANIYRKHGVPFPRDLHTAIAKLDDKDNGTAALVPQYNDLEYLVPVFIGTPPQELHVDVDTGSSDFWVFSTELPKDQINGQTVYDPAKSSSARKMSGATWKISYGDGSSSSGDVYLDVAMVGNISFAAQAVEAAQQVSPEFSNDANSDGVFGFAFSSLNQVIPDPQLTFFDNMIPKLEKSVFTVDLRHLAPGFLNLGFIDPNAYSGSIAYTPVNGSTGFWAIDSTGYTVGSGSFRKNNIVAIADTGATLLLLPPDFVDEYYSHVGGSKYEADQGGMTFRCSAVVPDLKVHLLSNVIGDDAGGPSVTIPGDYIRYTKIYNMDGTESGRCYGGLQSNIGLGISILGDIFLKSAFVVFDAEQPRLGLAKKA